MRKVFKADKNRSQLNTGIELLHKIVPIKQRMKQRYFGL